MKKTTVYIVLALVLAIGMFFYKSYSDNQEARTQQWQEHLRQRAEVMR